MPLKVATPGNSLLYNAFARLVGQTNMTSHILEHSPTLDVPVAIVVHLTDVLLYLESAA